MGVLRAYLTEIHATRATGQAVPETSYYPAVEKLLNAVGRGLRPQVRCVIHIKNRGAGIPDGGLFVSRQIASTGNEQLLLAAAPERGVLEVKPPSVSLGDTARTGQVRRYLDRYGRVLLTNLRGFLLVGTDDTGRPKHLESFELAESEAAFWEYAAAPGSIPVGREADLLGFLRRVLEHDAPLASPQDLAWFLAGYAREALNRLRGKEIPALAAVRKALEESLGLRFEGDRGDRFFRSTLVQTLFYGAFSAWVLWSKEQPAGSTEPFRWKQAAWSLNVPMVRILFEQVATPSRLGPLKLAELMDWVEQVLNRVDRTRFFARFQETRAVQYFYEPFLKEFDPELQRQLGVWYTPPEIVEYMVARVDRVLQEEFGLADGLADERVYILDPCTGTGSYLLEVLERIAKVLADRGDALSADDVKRAAMSRVFGFELLPAPFVVAHLQIGLLLARLGVPLDHAAGERAGVYLTNALTGWDAGPPGTPIPFPELQEERDAAEYVKREPPILVILGNPPYNGYAGVSPAEEGGLVEPYKQGLTSEWGITRNPLDDLYVRFFRVAERRIAEATGKGVVCLISNFSYLGDPSFVVMRQHLLREFDAITIDCMNGDSRETGKTTPDGRPDPSVFSTPYNPAGIQVGTAIALLVRRQEHEGPATVRFRHFWGAAKRAELLESLTVPEDARPYVPAEPTKDNYYSFRPTLVDPAYYSWPRLTELCRTEPLLGLLEKRGDALIDIDRASLGDRMRVYYDSSVSFAEFTPPLDQLARPWARFDPQATRARLLAKGSFDDTKIRRFVYRPLDVRWAYVDTTRPLWNEPRPELVRHAEAGARFLIVRRRAPRANDGAPMLYSPELGDEHCLHKDAYFIPFRTVPAPSAVSAGQGTFFDLAPAAQQPQANLSEKAAAYLAALGIPADDPEYPELLWLHALAIGYAPAYLIENADGVRGDWPRIPLPADRAVLRASADLGRRLAALLDPGQPVPGVTGPPLAPDLKLIGGIQRVGGGALDPDAGDLALTAGWGSTTRAGATMPGAGRHTRRVLTAAEREALAEVPGGWLGEEVHDVYLNDRAFWACVPAPVWDFKLGGYQVLRKWLSYREYKLLGRPLAAAEAREFTNLARRLASVILLGPKLNENFNIVRSQVFPWGRQARE